MTDTQRGTGRSTRQVLTQTQEVLNAAITGDSVTIKDHSDIEMVNRAQAKKVSSMLSVLGVNHSVDGNTVTAEPLKGALPIQSFMSKETAQELAGSVADIAETYHKTGDLRAAILGAVLNFFGHK